MLARAALCISVLVLLRLEMLGGEFLQNIFQLLRRMTLIYIIYVASLQKLDFSNLLGVDYFIHSNLYFHSLLYVNMAFLVP